MPIVSPFFAISIAITIIDDRILFCVYTTYSVVHLVCANNHIDSCRCKQRDAVLLPPTAIHTTNSDKGHRAHDLHPNRHDEPARIHTIPD